MKTKSAKNKGRRLQNYVATLIRKAFHLSKNDVRSTPMGVTGTDIQLSDKAFKLFPYSVECKNQEHLNIWRSWEQAKKHKYTPLLIIHRNRSDVLVVIDFKTFLKKEVRKCK